MIGFYAQMIGFNTQRIGAYPQTMRANTHCSLGTGVRWTQEGGGVGTKVSPNAKKIPQLHIQHNNSNQTVI